MRVISGKYRGRKLATPDGRHTRPTTDRVKEALFGAIHFNVPEASVLDLFAGSGALGIEALSRGAKACVFVEKPPRSIKSTERKPWVCNRRLSGNVGRLLVSAKKASRHSV